MLTAATRQLERLDELHAELVLVPGDRLGHVSADQRDVVEAAQLELGVGVPRCSHGPSCRTCRALIAHDRDEPVKPWRWAMQRPSIDRRLRASLPVTDCIQSADATSPSDPSRRGHLAGRPVDVPAVVRRPRPGRRARHGDRHAGQLVDGVRQLARRARARRSRLRPLRQPGPQGARRAARARPDPRRVARRQPVRVLPALQGLPRLRLLGGEDRGAQGVGGVRSVRARSSGRCSPTPTRWSSASAASTRPCSTP